MKDTTAETVTYTATDTTDSVVVTQTATVTFTAGTPVVLVVNPNTGEQGQQNKTVNLAGQFTNWVQGITTASFGAGITVAALTINSATTATAVLNIDPTASTEHGT